VGTCTLTASQAGSSVYYPASPVTQSFQVARLLVMGPQAMEGDLKVPAGTTIKVGYDFTIIGGKHAATYVSFLQPKVVFAYTCTSGSNSGSFTATIPDATILAGEDSSDWYPSDDQTDPSVYQGSVVVPNVCPSGSLVRLRQGGTFTTGIGSTETDRIKVRWHYSANSSGGNWSSAATVTPS